MHPEYFAYYRVSTTRQGESGLGLQAQQSATTTFLKSNGGVLLGEFTEVESGKKTDRKMLQRALSECRRTGAILLIAKLDRLARNVHFISGLLQSDVRFIAIDMPNADRFMLHVYAAMAEEEARRISERTKVALKAAKDRGVVLGANGRSLAQKRKARANQNAKTIGPKIDALKHAGLSYRAISDHLNTIGETTENGNVWHPTTVYRAHNRFRSLIV